MNYQKVLKALFWRTEFYGAVTTGGVAGMHRGMISGFNKLGNSVIYATSGKVKLPEYVKSYFIPYSTLYRNLPEILTLPYIKKSAKAVEKIILQENPDFLFQHHHDFNYGGTIIKKRTGIPFFLHCDFIQQWVKKNWGKLYFSHLLKWAEEIQWESSDAIFVISSIAKKIMTEEYGVNPDKIVVNPNGVDTDFFKNDDIAGMKIRSKLGLNGKIVNGFAGTFGVYHGAEYLASAVKEIVKRNHNAMFLFIGDGETRPKVQDIIKTAGIERNVIFTGLIPYNDVPAYLSACDILHTPCINNEDSSEYFGSPTKLFEYMGMGKPIIATNVGQQAEVIQNGINGILVNEKSPEEIAEAAILLSKEMELSEILSNNSRKDAIEKWDWVNNAKRIIQVYEKVMSK